LAAFAEVFAASVERHRGAPRHPAAAAAWTVVPQTVLAPREAFFADNETVPAGAAVGRVSAELIAPYPPGVPVLAPGELITAQALDALREVQADGGRIAYAADPTLATLQVVVRRLDPDHLAAAVDVVGRAGDRGVGHQEHGERGQVFRLDHPADGQLGPQLLAALF
jgi:arginine/lysine/ornithine decarboxylase